jgi:hypothetical protein
LHQCIEYDADESQELKSGVVGEENVLDIAHNAVSSVFIEFNIGVKEEVGDHEENEAAA